MLKWLSFIFLFYLEVDGNCNYVQYGLYCTNLKTNNESDTLVIDTVEDTNNKIKSIFLRNSSGTIGKPTFSDLELESLDIQFCSIKNISTHIQSLEILYIMNNLEFPNINETLMKNFPELRILYISNNQGLKIHNNSFKHMQNLHHLTINGLEITYLSNDYLEGLTELTYLDLQRNNIQLINETAFNETRKLNNLILRNNKIIKFEIDTFMSLKNLESLDLIGTDLMQFDPKLFKNQKELKYIGMPSNIVKENLQLRQLNDAFKKLESIGLCYDDQNDTAINGFIELCEKSGFEIKLVKI